MEPSNPDQTDNTPPSALETVTSVECRVTKEQSGRPLHQDYVQRFSETEQQPSPTTPRISAEEAEAIKQKALEILRKEYPPPAPEPKVQSLKSKVQSLECMVQGSEPEVQSSESKVLAERTDWYFAKGSQACQRNCIDLV